jgi:hypothetical protein
MGVDNLWSQTLFYNKLYLMNFGRWNYNCAFYYYYLTFIRMGNLQALLANGDATDKQIFRGNVKETSTMCCC